MRSARAWNPGSPEVAQGLPSVCHHPAPLWDWGLLLGPVQSMATSPGSIIPETPSPVDHFSFRQFFTCSLFKAYSKPGIVVQSWETEAGGCKVPGQPEREGKEREEGRRKEGSKASEEPYM